VCFSNNGAESAPPPKVEEFLELRPAAKIKGLEVAVFEVPIRPEFASACPAIKARTTPKNKALLALSDPLTLQ